MKNEDIREIEEMISREAKDEQEAEELLSIAKGIMSIKPARSSEAFQQELKAKLEQKSQEQSDKSPRDNSKNVISLWRRWARPLSLAAAAAAFAIILNASGLFGVLLDEEQDPSQPPSEAAREDASQESEDFSHPRDSLEIAMKPDEDNDDVSSEEGTAENGEVETDGDGDESVSDEAHEEDGKEEEKIDETETPSEPSSEPEEKEDEKEDDPGEIIIYSEALGDLTISGGDDRLSPLVLGDAPLSEPANVNYVLQRFPEFPGDKPLYSSYLNKWSEDEVLSIGGTLDFEGEPIKADGDLVFREEDEKGGRLLSFFVEEGRLIYYCYFNEQGASTGDTSQEKLIDSSQALATAKAFMDDLGFKPGEVASFEEGKREGRQYWEVIFYPYFNPEKGKATLSVARIDKTDNSVIYFSHERAGLEADKHIDLKDEEAFISSLKQVEVFAPDTEVTLKIKDVELAYMQREMRAALYRASWEPFFILKGESKEEGEEFTYYFPAEK